MEGLKESWILNRKTAPAIRRQGLPCQEKQVCFFMTAFPIASRSLSYLVEPSLSRNFVLFYLLLTLTFAARQDVQAIKDKAADALVKALAMEARFRVDGVLVVSVV